MTTYDPTAQLQMPARICINPTAGALANRDFPFGGTEIGFTKDLEFRPNVQAVRTVAAEWGTDQASEVDYQGESPVFGAILREWDDDAILTVFPASAVGIGGSTIVDYNPVTGVRAGTRQSQQGADRAVSLLVVPTSELIDVATSRPNRNLTLWLPAAIPLPKLAAVLNWSPARQLGIAVFFEGLPATNGRAHLIAKTNEITIV